MKSIILITLFSFASFANLRPTGKGKPRGCSDLVRSILESSNRSLQVKKVLNMVKKDREVEREIQKEELRRERVAIYSRAIVQMRKKLIAFEMPKNGKVTVHFKENEEITPLRWSFVAKEFIEWTKKYELLVPQGREIKFQLDFTGKNFDTPQTGMLQILQEEFNLALSLIVRETTNQTYTANSLEEYLDDFSLLETELIHPSIHILFDDQSSYDAFLKHLKDDLKIEITPGLDQLY